MFENYVLTGRPFDLVVAFAAGFVTFFASCLLPLVPTYLAYLSGVSLTGHKTSRTRGLIFRQSLFFVLGFILIFSLAGALTAYYAPLVAKYRLLLQKLGGILFTLLGLSVLGWLPNGKLQQLLIREYKFDLSKYADQLRGVSAWRSFLVGVVFAAGWTPCVGPILALIIFWASHASHTVLGLLLLLIYGLGLGTPFILIALFFEKLLPFLQKQRLLLRRISQLAALMLLMTGILLLLGQFQGLSLWLIESLGLRHLSA